jgi:tetratricopeptide (TPR) repeat protein
MAQHVAANPPADTADPISNAVTSPVASRFVRLILQNALANPAGPPQGAPPDWTAEVQALLVNVMMNDHFNWWNLDLPVDIDDAQKCANLAIKAKPSPPVLAHAYHARGLTYRAQGSQQAASDDFEYARTKLDQGFARAHAQAGNQKVLLGQAKNSHGDFQTARKLAPNHPASGYFDWGEGRACFQEAATSAGKPDWSEAIRLLKTSIKELPTVWYNRLYLACAQDADRQTVAAQQTLDCFRAIFGQPMLDQLKALPPPSPGDPMFAARQLFYDWLRKAK